MDHSNLNIGNAALFVAVIFGLAIAKLCITEAMKRHVERRDAKDQAVMDARVEAEVAKADEPYNNFVKDMAVVRPKPLKSLDYSPSSLNPVFIEPPVIESYVADEPDSPIIEAGPRISVGYPDMKVTGFGGERDCA